MHEEVPREKAKVETFETLKKRHGSWHPAVGCHQKPKKWTQGNDGSQKKLAAAYG
jgi:hypothetical protein